MSQKRVLVVDDDHPSLSMLQTVLEADGHTVGKAYSAAEAIRVWSEFAPEVVITDNQMPDKSGLELVEYLRERITTPVVMYSAHIDEEVKQSAPRLQLEVVEKGQLDQLREYVNQL